MLVILISVIPGLTDVVNGVEFPFAYSLCCWRRPGDGAGALPVRDGLALHRVFLYEVSSCRWGSEAEVLQIFGVVFSLIGQMGRGSGVLKALVVMVTLGSH
jgi:hypothetical protein